MDLEEWEYLSDDGFIDQLHHQDGSGKRVNSRETQALHPNSQIDMNYFQKFIDPENKSAVDRTRIPPKIVIPVPAEFDLSVPASPRSFPVDELVVKEVISPDNPPIPDPVGVLEPEGDKETVSRQVFFKKTRENEFADMKLDSPKSANRGFVPQIDLGKPPQFQEEEDFEDGKKIPSIGAVVSDCKEKFADPDENEWEDEKDHGGLNIWKMGMTGIGALCSFGFACATICVIAFGNRHREKHQDQKLHFQIYADEKRIKQVVHHASKLNEAISAARGAPLSRAQITIGGYFEGL